MKTINDIKSTEDMVGITLEIDVEITEDIKNKLSGLHDICNYENDWEDEMKRIESCNKYISLRKQNTDSFLRARTYNPYENNTIIKLSDFLNIKNKKEKTMKYAMIINDTATFFETEEEANTQLREALTIGQTGYLALNIQKLEAVKKFKTTTLNKKKKPAKKTTKKVAKKTVKKGNK